jgi:hypothetical protein
MPHRLPTRYREVVLTSLNRGASGLLRGSHPLPPVSTDLIEHPDERGNSPDGIWKEKLKEMENLLHYSPSSTRMPLSRCSSPVP